MIIENRFAVGEPLSEVWLAELLSMSHVDTGSDRGVMPRRPFKDDLSTRSYRGGNIIKGCQGDK
jgi:hypothetical protein